MTRALAMVAAIAALAAGLAAPVPSAPGLRTTGDEPHYLMSAVSLGEDGDLDVADEYAERRFAPFHGATLVSQGRPTASGRIVEPHDPLLAALLAAPVRLGGWLGARLALALLAGAPAALTTWTAVRRLDVPIGLAAPLTAFLAASAPLAVYGAQVYPELPAALLLIAGVAAVSGSLGRAGLGVAVGSAALLPWLGSKYAPLALVVVAVAGARLWSARRARAALAAGAAVAASAALLGIVHRVVYGGWTAYAAGARFAEGELGVVGSDPDYAGRAVRLVGLLVDRDFGIASWQPAWLLAVPALAALARVRPRGASPIALALAAGWLTAAFAALTIQGWWFPGRQVVVVLPLAALALLWWVAHGPRALRVLALGLAAVGVVTYAALLLDGLRGRVTWVVDFAAASDPLGGAWRALLPDYLDPSALTWPLHTAWAGLAIGALILGWLGAARASAARAATDGAHGGRAG